MKQKISIVIFLLMIGYPSTGCDVCGCSLGGNYYGILPMFNKNFVGLRWSQAKFHSYIHEGNYLPAQYSNDTYNKVELWGRYYVSKKLQVFAFVPYVYNDMNGSDQVVSANGIGDISLTSNYFLFNTGADSSKLVRHSLLVGGGVKLPTGKHGLEDQGKIINRNFQMGTGSVDFLLTSVYTVRFQKFGVNMEAGYKINTRNPDDYIFGNQFHVSSQFFYWQQIKSFSMLPNIGVYYETAQRHKDGDIIQPNTGGSSVLAAVGMETYYRNLSFGATYNHPLVQHYNSDETVDISANDRWSVSLTYTF